LTRGIKTVISRLPERNDATRIGNETRREKKSDEKGIDRRKNDDKIRLPADAKRDSEMKITTVMPKGVAAE
jgi:hypothetical protein